MAAKKFVELYVRPPSISKIPRYATGSVPDLLDLHLQAPPAWIPGHVADQTLRARRSSDVAVPLTRDWVLVVRDEVLAKWQRGSWPPFPSGVGPWIFTLDSVARALTREDFNRLALTCMFDPPDFANCGNRTIVNAQIGAS